MENENLEIQQDPEVISEKETKEQPGWFQDFVDHYEVDKPKQGEILKGTILNIQESSILLDVGLKRDAIIPAQDLEKLDQNFRENINVGDEVFVSVIRTPVGGDDLLVSLSKGLDHEIWAKAEELAKNKELIELEVIDQNRGGILVEYEKIRGFIPNSHIPSIRRGTSTQKAGEIKAELIGKKLPVKAIEVNQKEHRLVFSARVALKNQRLKRLNEIEVGTVIKSRVVNVVDFGIFVDLDGVDGLVHKSEIDWERIPDLKKKFKIGDEIEVKVVGVDIEQERVSLSRKALLPNPWQKLADNYNVGDIVEGKVVSVLDFGAFVELQEGLQGLVHVSEIGYTATEDPSGVVKKGDLVLIRIMGIDPRRERISLSMRRVPVSKQMDWMMNLEEISEEIQENEIDTAKGKEKDQAIEEEPTPEEYLDNEINGMDAEDIVLEDDSQSEGPSDEVAGETDGEDDEIDQDEEIEPGKNEEVSFPDAGDNSQME